MTFVRSGYLLMLPTAAQVECSHCTSSISHEFVAMACHGVEPGSGVQHAAVLADAACWSCQGLYRWNARTPCLSPLLLIRLGSYSFRSARPALRSKRKRGDIDRARFSWCDIAMLRCIEPRETNTWHRRSKSARRLLTGEVCEPCKGTQRAGEAGHVSQTSVCLQPSNLMTALHANEPAWRCHCSIKHRGHTRTKATQLQAGCLGSYTCEPECFECTTASVLASVMRRSSEAAKSQMLRRML